MPVCKMDIVTVSEDLEAFSAAPGTPVPVLPLQDSNNDDLKRLTVDQDSAFLSKSCYQRQSDNSFHWCLNYTHDVFRGYGDKRQLNKWCRFVKDIVVKSEMFDNDDPDVVFHIERLRARLNFRIIAGINQGPASISFRLHSAELQK